MTTIKNELDDILKKYYLSGWRIADEVVKKYDVNVIDEFLKYNSSYVGEHSLYCKDVEIFLNIQEVFKNKTKKSKKVKQGDILEVHSNNGHIFYKNAHIEKCGYNETGWTYCEQASPHFSASSESFSTSGGAWSELDIKGLEYLGQRIKTVWTWGSCGAKGNGGIYIPVLVNVFKLQTDRKFVPYSVSYSDGADGYGYKFYLSSYDKKTNIVQSAFKTKTGLKNYLKNRGLRIGKIFNKGWSTSHEIIGDFNEKCYMDFEEFKTDKGDLKTFPVLSNGDYTEGFLKDGTLCYCNPNVKQRAILPRPLYQ
jgi:hypothetical protein